MVTLVQELCQTAGKLVGFSGSLAFPGMDAPQMGCCRSTQEDEKRARDTEIPPITKKWRLDKSAIWCVVQLLVYVSIYLSVCLSIYPVCLSVYLSTSVSLSIFLYLVLYLSLSLSFSLSALFIGLSIYLCAFLCLYT